MDCPQCGTALTTLSLQGHEALVCERCGYVGIDADHHGKRRSTESWHDALRRFYDESGVDSDPHVPVRPDDADGTRTDDGTSDGPPRPTPREVSGGTPALSRTVDGDVAEAEGPTEGRTEGEKGGTDASERSVGDGVRSSASES